jgi:prepilin-type N-terminal cleavage/methylation domain-containing protein
VPSPPHARTAGHGAPDPAQSGFTMVESLIAIAVICVVMLALTSFLVTAVRTNHEQGGQGGSDSGRGRRDGARPGVEGRGITDR